MPIASTDLIYTDNEGHGITQWYNMVISTVDLGESKVANIISG